MKPFAVEAVHQLDSDVISVAATANFSTICACTTGRTLYLIDGRQRSTGASIALKKKSELDGEAWATAITDDASRVAVGTAHKNPAKGRVYVFDHDLNQMYCDHVETPVWSVGFSGDGQWLVAATWGNLLYSYQFKPKKGTYERAAVFTVDGGHGLYGAKVTRDGRFCSVVSYDHGVYLLNLHAEEISSWCEMKDGLYNVAIGHSPEEVVVGTRSGGVLRLRWNRNGEFIPPTDADVSTFSDRPIYGVATSEGGWLTASGSSGGKLYLTDRAGKVLWDWQSRGEIWSTAISSSGSLICVGSGDHTVTLLRNNCDNAARQEMHHAEPTLAADNSAAMQYCLSLYRRYGLLEYGCRQIETAEGLKFQDRARVLKEFLEGCIRSDAATPYVHFRLAEVLFQQGDSQAAIGHYQHASADDTLRSLAQRRLASCFEKESHQTAASSAWRQSRNLHLDAEAYHTLFMIGRSYEDEGQWANAAKVFEMIVARDKDHRRVWEGLRQVTNNHTNRAPRINTTGVTVSLTSDDVIRAVDNVLAEVRTARQRERGYTGHDQTARSETARRLFEDEAFSAGVRRDYGALAYSEQGFLRYDFGLPEDEIKKFLETVNAAPIFDELVTDLAKEKSMLKSLDIGSATGRYPTLLRGRRFESYGLDVEEKAVKYANKKKELAGGGDFPRYVCGDARQLDGHRKELPIGDFHLLTCMMGTFEHLKPNEQVVVLKHMYTALRTGGRCVISIWDVECPHLAYLSMYDEAQRVTFNKHARTQSDMKELMQKTGFEQVKVVPFALLPQSVFYDLGVAQLEQSDIQIIVHADLVLHKLYPRRHGEMFLVIGRKP